METAAFPARCLPAGELNRATDMLLEATAEAPGQAEAAARAAVAEYADWCAIDLLDRNGALQRVAVATARDIEENHFVRALSRFAEPDPGMLGRLELARSPIRVENPTWMPHHRAVAAAVDGGGGVRGAIVALIPLEDHDLAGDLWFMGTLGRRVAQVLGMCTRSNSLGGVVGAESIRAGGHSRVRLRPAL